VARDGQQAGPGAAEAPAAAVRGALRYVQHFNAHALVSGAQAAVAEAWLQLTQVCTRMSVCVRVCVLVFVIRLRVCGVCLS